MKYAVAALILLSFSAANAQDTTRIDTVTLRPVHVTAKRRKSEYLEEFHRRAEQAARGGGGYILARAELERAGQMPIPRLLATVPGIHYVGSRGDVMETVYMTRGNCAPRIYLDGAPLANNNINMISSESLEGVEVYAGVGSGPAEFFDPRGCGTVLLWSQRGTLTNTAKYPIIGLAVVVAIAAFLISK